MRYAAFESIDGWQCSDWKEVRSSFLEALDSELDCHNLELVVCADDGSDSYLWTIEPKQEDDK